MYWPPGASGGGDKWGPVTAVHALFHLDGWAVQRLSAWEFAVSEARTEPAVHGCGIYGLGMFVFVFSRNAASFWRMWLQGSGVHKLQDAGQPGPCNNATQIHPAQAPHRPGIVRH